LNIV